MKMQAQLICAETWSMKLNRLLWLSAAVRIALVVIGDCVDNYGEVPYTDIDYTVFTDAARYVTEGASPYHRNTYRYSPLLAYLLVPNILLHRSFGKVLFSLLDILVGWLTAKLAVKLGATSSQGCWAAAAWLYNPYTVTISTRGSCDVIVVALLLATLWFLSSGDALTAAVMYGLAVHMRIYPIIYVPSIVLFLAARSVYKHEQRMRQKVKAAKDEQNDASPHDTLQATPQPDSLAPKGWSFPRSRRQFEDIFLHVGLHTVLFGAVSGGLFLFLGWLFFKMYGQEFLHEAFLHHIGRKDPRHNFSMYFYPIYLNDFGGMNNVGGGISQHEPPVWQPQVSGNDPLSQVVSGLAISIHQAYQIVKQPAVLAFLPQLVLLMALAGKLHAHLPLCWLAQTIIFVALNKVCTAQYFVWWLSLLPLLLHELPRPVPRLLLASALVWVIAQLHWLGWAYLLEFKGMSLYFAVWIASIVFLAANIFLLTQILLCFNMDVATFLRASLHAEQDQDVVATAHSSSSGTKEGKQKQHAKTDVHDNKPAGRKGLRSRKQGSNEKASG